MCLRQNSLYSVDAALQSLAFSCPVLHFDIWTNMDAVEVLPLFTAYCVFTYYYGVNIFCKKNIKKPRGKKKYSSKFVQSHLIFETTEKTLLKARLTHGETSTNARVYSSMYQVLSSSLASRPLTRAQKTASRQTERCRGEARRCETTRGHIVRSRGVSAIVYCRH